MRKIHLPPDEGAGASATLSLSPQPALAAFSLRGCSTPYPDAHRFDRGRPTRLLSMP